MTEVIRPYADLKGIFAGIDYRHSLAVAFQPIDVSEDSASTVVRVDDLRTIPQHQLRVRLNLDALKPHYEHHMDALQLVLLARDTTLRRELQLGRFQLDAIPTTIDLDRNLLRVTALRDLLPLNLSVILKDRIKGGPELPLQRASRLAEFRFTIANTAGGATFPFKRVTAAELRTAGKPSETGVFLNLLCGPEELIIASDTPISSLLEVWVHEKIWTAVQNDRGPATSRLRLGSITLLTSTLILSAVVPLLREGKEIAELSVVGQLLSYAEKQGGMEEGELRRRFQSDASVHDLDPWLQNAWRFVSLAGRIQEEVGEEASP
jgi:hypothetical protein